MDSTPKITQWIIDEDGRVLDAVVEQGGWTIKLFTEKVCLGCLSSLSDEQLVGVSINRELKTIFVNRYDLATKVSECDYLDQVDGHSDTAY